MNSDRWPRIEELFQGALEQPEESRDQWLASQTTDPAVLTDVRALLRADAGQGDRVISDSIARAAEEIQAQLDAPDPTVGMRVGPYQLLKEIGRGGMGTVYLAERADDEYRSRVAIKFVRGRLAAPELARRFVAERQILADLTHPSIAWLLDGGTTEDGTPYLVMEYVDGLPIDEWCDQQGLGLDQRLALFRRVVDAVRYAHARLVVHRDLKPSNILVTADGTPKLVDFGIAKLLGGDDPTITTASLRFLTPAYAAPEQLLGGSITVATDVYALGGVLYKLLTNRTPHDLSGLAGADVAHLVTQVDPALASTAVVGTARHWARRLTGDLDTIISVALHKEPERRYGSAERLDDDLRRHGAGLPVAAQPDTVGYRLGKFVRRRRTELIITLVAIVTLAGLGLYHTRQITAERNIARLEAAKANEVADFLTRIFEVSDPSVSRGETVTARELLDAAALRIDSELADQPRVQASLMGVIGNVYATLGLSEQAEPMLRGALERNRSLYGEQSDETATSERSWAVWLQDEGRNDEAIPLFRSAIATLASLHGARSEPVGIARRDYAYLLQSEGADSTALVEMSAALAIIRSQSPVDSSELAETLTHQGRLLRQMERLDEAEPLLREGLLIEQQLHGELDPDVASSMRNLASLLRDQHRNAEADSLYRKTIAIRRKLFGEDHPEVANALNSYAILLSNEGQADSAIKLTQGALAILERLHDGPHPAIAAGYSNLGGLLAGAGRRAEAEQAYRESMSIQDQVLQADHPNRAYPRLGLARVLISEGRSAEAIKPLREALRVRQAKYPAGDHHLVEVTALLDSAGGR